MSETEDMQPVTRGELRIEFQQFEERFEKKIDAKFDAKFDIFLGAMLARLDQMFAARDARRDEMFAARDARLDEMFAARDARLEQILDARDVRLYAALGRHTRANEEGLSGRVAVVDEKYADLPDRVTKLEEAVLDGRPRP